MTDDQHVIRPTCTRAGVRAAAPITEEHPCLDGLASPMPAQGRRSGLHH